jgi:SAM-dependent methyltransferase
LWNSIRKVKPLHKYMLSCCGDDSWITWAHYMKTGHRKRHAIPAVNDAGRLASTRLKDVPLDRLLHLENLQQEFNKLPFVKNTVNITKVCDRSHQRKHWTEYYNQELADEVYEWLAPDFELGDYSRDSWKYGIEAAPATTTYENTVIADMEESAKAFFRKRSRQTHEPVSGPGSMLANTEDVRNWLTRNIPKLNVKKIVDVGCGDWSWMRLIIPQHDIEYVGYDIVPEIIQNNQERFGNDRTRFELLNPLREKPEAGDLVICRDLLFHLANRHVQAIIDHFRLNGSRYLLATHFEQGDNQERSDAWQYNRRGLSWRPLNLIDEPFSVRPVVDRFVENTARNKYREMILIGLDKWL